MRLLRDYLTILRLPQAFAMGHALVVARARAGAALFRSMVEAACAGSIDGEAIVCAPGTFGPSRRRTLRCNSTPRQMPFLLQVESVNGRVL
jgi:hypothetical protein